MFLKIKSKEYLELCDKLEKLRIEIEALKLDLALYTRKLRATKGVKYSKDESENNKNSVLLPE